MGSLHKHMIFDHESQILPPIKTSQTPTTYQSPLLPTSHNNNNSNFPILPIAILCIMATALLLVIYYILLAKCCFNWQQLDPLRLFSLPRPAPPPPAEDPLTAYSPSVHSHGLDEFLIRDIPTFQYRKLESRDKEEFIYKCVVCLSEFHEHDVLRVLPKCGHGFHLDCIDIWLQSNSNCPLCRTSISGENRCPIDRIVAPNSSPQDTHLGGDDDDFVVIELTNGIQERNEQREVERKFDELIKTGNVRKQGKFRRVSIMGDECIDAMRAKDDHFCVQPMRRSFSLDSAADPHVYLVVQEIMRQSGIESEVRNNRGESSSRVRRPFFPFGNGRSSRSAAVLPIEF